MMRTRGADGNHVKDGVVGGAERRLTGILSLSPK
jgi:hypothetical protein